MAGKATARTGESRFLALLGMEIQEKGKSRSRFPSGMTTK
jgi:hypothetical protein